MRIRSPSCSSNSCKMDRNERAILKNRAPFWIQVCVDISWPDQEEKEKAKMKKREEPTFLAVSWEPEINQRQYVTNRELVKSGRRQIFSITVEREARPRKQRATEPVT